jgi:hypothetical protein
MVDRATCKREEICGTQAFLPAGPLFAKLPDRRSRIGYGIVVTKVQSIRGEEQ